MVGEEREGLLERLLGGAEGAECEVAFGLAAQVACAGEVGDAGVGVCGRVRIVVVRVVSVRFIIEFVLIRLIVEFVFTVKFIIGFSSMRLIIGFSSMRLIIEFILIRLIIEFILIRLIVERILLRLIIGFSSTRFIIRRLATLFTSFLSPSLTLSHRIHHRQQLLIRRHRLPKLAPSRQRRRQRPIQRQRQRVRHRLLRHSLTTD